MVIEQGGVRSSHLIGASRLMGREHFYPYIPRADAGKTAWQLAVAWLEEYARTHPDWVRELEGVIKRPVVAWIVDHMHVHGAERVLASVFAGFLLDLVFQWAVDRELGQSAPASSQEMFNGPFVDLLGRWVASFVHELPAREAWPLLGAAL